jgi:oligopeptide/dipeptide ABC transporter ATP-binding protein
MTADATPATIAAERGTARPADTTGPLLDVRDLSVVYESARQQPVTAVDGVSFSLARGEFVGLVGESGSGKSTLGYAVTRLQKPPARTSSGRILFGGRDIRELGAEKLRRQRQGGFAMVLQAGMNALNPVRTVEDHFADVLRAHRRVTGRQITERAAGLLDRVHLPAATLRRYPHELSGGMRQRVAIAVALALDPRLVVFDEPTTALDVIVQDAVMATIRELQRENGFTALLISHDLGTVVDATDRLLVMYAGRIVEDRPSATVLRHAAHPYTRALLRCYADPRADEVHLEGIPGAPPDLSLEQTACPFAPRCPRREDACLAGVPPLLPLGAAHAACTVVHREAKEAAGDDR